MRYQMRTDMNMISNLRVWSPIMTINNINKSITNSLLIIIEMKQNSRGNYKEKKTSLRLSLQTNAARIFKNIGLRLQASRDRKVIVVVILPKLNIIFKIGSRQLGKNEPIRRLIFSKMRWMFLMKKNQEKGRD